MNTEPNPYASSPVNEPASRKHQPTSPDFLDFVPIMRRWERLRFYYNVVLIALVLFVSILAFPQNVIRFRFWVSVCLGGLIANTCFLAGPTIEAYGTRFRLWSGGLTAFLFLSGLALTAVLAIWCIANYRVM